MDWSKQATTKGICHIHIRENRVQENAATKFVVTHYIDGKVNLSDILAKEMKDTSHFVELWDIFICQHFQS
jgi:hypothetical protein